MNFDELKTTIMNLRMNKNYQPVFIKTLLESTDYQASREEIISKLKESNQNRERDWGQSFGMVVNEVLSQKENLIKYSTETKVLKLLVDESSIHIKVDPKGKAVIHGREFLGTHWLLKVEYENSTFRIKQPIDKNFITGQRCSLNFIPGKEGILFPGAIVCKLI